MGLLSKLIFGGSVLALRVKTAICTLSVPLVSGDQTILKKVPASHAGLLAGMKRSNATVVHCTCKKLVDSEFTSGKNFPFSSAMAKAPP